mmetsp:Transcript_19486/g.58891  ORF Transcript_19486/g.58891 Transcript_19486/m.58891 type:complete len:257 (-) Transcript_19486:1844-2614(-)
MRSGSGARLRTARYQTSRGTRSGTGIGAEPVFALQMKSDPASSARRSQYVALMSSGASMTGTIFFSSDASTMPFASPASRPSLPILPFAAASSKSLSSRSSMSIMLSVPTIGAASSKVAGGRMAPSNSALTTSGRLRTSPILATVPFATSKAPSPNSTPGNLPASLRAMKVATKGSWILRYSNSRRLMLASAGSSAHTRDSPSAASGACGACRARAGRSWRGRNVAIASLNDGSFSSPSLSNPSSAYGSASSSSSS